MIPLIGITALAALGYLLYLDITRPGGPGGTELIGTIISKSNVAERKYSRDVIWADVHKDSDLYNYDTIRTADGSQVLIRLKNGTEITLNENSMILLAITDEEVGIQFLEGSINAKQKAGTEPGSQKVSIISGDSRISLEDSDIRLAQDSENRLKMTVNRGTALLKSGTTEQLVLQDQELVAGSGEIRVNDLSIRLIAPDSNRHFALDDASTRVDFSWETLRGAYRTNLEIAKNPSMSDPVINRVARDGSERVLLGEGVYYWRVIAVNAATKKVEMSEMRRVVIFNNRPSRLLLPENGSVISYRDSNPLINFVWSGNESASGYSLQVSQNQDMSAPVIDANVQLSRIAINNLGEGSYFWKVVTIPDSDQIEGRSESAVHRFSIVKSDRIDPPLPLSPAEGKNIHAVLIAQKGLSFNWQKGREIPETELIISKDSEFSRIVARQTSSGNFINLTDSLDTGDYFWRIRGMLSDSSATDYSATRRFRVISEGSITLLEPADRAVINLDGPNKASDIRFSWSNTGLEGTYHIQVSRTRDFSTMYKESSLDGLAMNITGLTEGGYHWRVTQNGEDGTELMASPVHSFDLAGTLVAPAVLAPARGSTVDMIKKDTLDFSWRPVRGANRYRLTLYHVVGGVQRAVATMETRNTLYTFSDLKKLDIGTFIWTVQAFETYPGENRVKRKSDEVKIPFKITLGIKGDIKIDAPSVVRPE